MMFKELISKKHTLCEREREREKAHLVHALGDGDQVERELVRVQVGLALCHQLCVCVCMCVSGTPVLPSNICWLKEGHVYAVASRHFFTCFQWVVREARA